MVGYVVAAREVGGLEASSSDDEITRSGEHISQPQRRESGSIFTEVNSHPNQYLIGWRDFPCFVLFFFFSSFVPPLPFLQRFRCKFLLLCPEFKTRLSGSHSFSEFSLSLFTHRRDLLFSDSLGQFPNQLQPTTLLSRVPFCHVNYGSLTTHFHCSLPSAFFFLLLSTEIVQPCLFE
jgi:hypothetical protein